MNNFDPNDLFYEMVDIYSTNKTPENKITICNEGSSRSSKTWDFIHLLVMFLDHNRNKGLEVYVLRNTLTDCRDFAYKEFEKAFGVIGIIDIVSKKESPKPYMKLYGNHIYFRGLDEDKEAPPSDIIFVNEALEVETRRKLKGWFMRCRMLQVLDWNPKFSQHWCFDMEGTPNVYFTRSTYKNNKHLEKSVVNEIESYCPWHFDDLHLPKKKRRPHPTNIKNGTADDYQWEVYGEGKRTAPEGLIFQHVEYIDKFPDIAYTHTIDFGFTADPTAINKYAEDTHNIWIELLLYEPTENADLIHEFAISSGINIKLPSTADSADKYTGENKGTVEMVRDLKAKGWRISKVSKTKSVMYWLTSMKKKKIHIVKNHNYIHAKKEQENYRMKLINGIAINQPIDKFNHMWDSARYGHIAYNSKTSGMW